MCGAAENATTTGEQFVTSHLEELTGYVGAVAARALLDWADLNGRELVVPAQSWVSRGFTDALLAPLFVNDPDIGGQLVVVKVLPPGETAEPRAHRRAIREAPEKFKVRLVRQIFEPYAMPPPGGVLTFQGLAGGSARGPLADVPAEHIPAASAFLTPSLIAEWNPRSAYERWASSISCTAKSGSNVQWDRISRTRNLPSASWLRSDQDPPLPSPLPLIGAESLFGDALVDVVVGRMHSDLHDLNVLLRQRDDDHWIDTFVLVDLMTYPGRAARPGPGPAAAVGDRSPAARPVRPPAHVAAVGVRAARRDPRPALDRCRPAVCDLPDRGD